LRIGKWSGDSAWEFEDMHHKIYLTNTTPEVEHFSISHGYNLFTINRAWRTQHQYIWRVGLGLVVAHPESTIRGQTWDEGGGTLNQGGYYIAGPTAMVALLPTSHYMRILDWGMTSKGSYTQSLFWLGLSESGA
jgi:hypothetical protein